MVSSVCVRGENGDTHGHGDGAGVDEVDGARVVAELLLDVVHLELDIGGRVAGGDGDWRAGDQRVRYVDGCERSRPMSTP